MSIHNATAEQASDNPEGADSLPARTSYLLRLPIEHYDALKAYAFFTNTSMNEVIDRAIVAFLTGPAREEELAAIVSSGQERYRTALDKLKEL